ncbi:S8 family serine peptidase [Candidatus Kaiserbacteria bacterium]|nr:S8 family serine peptidase [Candidatus Kaiserbacteria bacterium]
MKSQPFSYLYIGALLTVLAGLAALASFSPAFAHAQVPHDPRGDRVFVLFDTPVGDAERGLVRAFGGDVKYSYSIVNAVAATIPASAIEGLSHNPHVLAIEPDLEVQATDIELDNSWGVERIGGGAVHATFANKGTGVKIGIIDSGINYLHPDLNDNYRGGYDFYYYDHDPMDVYGHGTHVAGAACAEDNNLDGTTSADPKLGVVGVAPGCGLYSLRVLNEDGVGYFSDIVAAVQWSLGDEVYLPAWGTTAATTTQGIPMDVVNLSLGQSQDPGVTVRQAFDAAYNRGLLIVAAAGNSGNPGGKGNNVIYPAKYDSVIAVAATDSSDRRASFSSTGDQVELAAPGVSVYSTWNNSSSYSNPQPVCTASGECYKYGSGTSMASPHVAGTAALIIAAGVTDTSGNTFINDEVRALLQSTAIDLDSSGRDSRYGFGLVDALAAIRAVVSPVPPPPPPDTAIVLEATGYKVKGLQKVSLSWSGATTAQIDIYRDNALIITTVNDNSYTDAIDQKGAGAYVYKVCEAETATCSNESAVTF